MGHEVALYELDDGTHVAFEVDAPPGYRLAGKPDLSGQVRAAVGPALAAAQVVVEKARQATPDNVSVKFGIKVSGESNWWIAKASTEGNFEITLTWNK